MENVNIYYLTFCLYKGMMINKYFLKCQIIIKTYIVSKHDVTVNFMF